MHVPLTEQALFPAGPLRRLSRHVFLLDEVDSTNAWLLARAAELPDGTVVAAEFQTVGRGRLGRRWESPRGASILLSVLLHEPPDSLLLRRATLLAALAACEAIEHATVCKPGVRWPNDLVLAGRKLGGVLVESTTLAGDTPRRAAAVGLGLNCFQQRGHFSRELAETATSLEIESAAPVDRLALARSLVERLDARLAPAPPVWDAVLADWKARCEDIGARVTLQQDRQTCTGTVVDISDDGDLLVQLDHGGRRYFPATTTTRVA